MPFGTFPLLINTIRMHAVVSFLILFFVAQFTVAQGSGAIKGRVFDRETGDPLPGANLVIQGTSIGAAADLDGIFYIRNAPAGEKTVRVSYLGYQTLTTQVTVTENAVLEQDFRLTAEALEGETVIVTAQARGQNAAINQQISSNTIANIVSQARIKELPDVNAAESIGRLPGVSINRSGGEATQVSIRGLSPKYNIVTVNGVALPATGGDDRSADLSLISSNTINGIELKKAPTADMDADFLGGSIDLRLKEAPDEMEVNLSAQGGYNQLQKYYGNYNFNGNISNRFFENDLGIIGTFQFDNYDRSADKFDGNYRTAAGPIAVGGIMTNDMLLREETVNRKRSGGSILLDYRIPFGKIAANGFYNRLEQDQLFRIDRMNLQENRHYYDMEERNNITSIFIGGIGVQQDFQWVKYDFGVSRTGSIAENPEDKMWGFVQENTAYSNTNIRYTRDVQQFVTPKDSITGLRNIFIEDIKRNENQTNVQANIQIPFLAGDLLNGYIKFGGKYRWLNRTNNENRYGRDAFQYGSTTGVSTPLAILLQRLSDLYPQRFNWPRDSALVRNNSVMPIIPFLGNTDRPTSFLGGEYYFTRVMDLEAMNMATEALRGTSEWYRYSTESIGRDYDGIERFQAAYIMTELNVTKYVTLIPGIRWEKDHSKYNGQRYRQVNQGFVEGDPVDLASLTSTRDFEFWLPQMHLIISPADWLKIRLARTETLTRPDYIQYAPITSMNGNNNYVRAANSGLKPARSENYDISMSVYENTLGLFTISGFQKSISDLILQTTIYYQRDMLLPEGLNIPDGSDNYLKPDSSRSDWLTGNAPQIDTYINNKGIATYDGFEIDWQTHFWYLPSFLNGLILNVNYTRLFSKIDLFVYAIRQGDRVPGTGVPGRPLRYYKLLVDSSRTARMPDQPKHTANITLGYDLSDFSVRLSYLYQSDKTRSFAYQGSILDGFTGTYERWDLTLQQRFLESFQVYVNLNNLNNRQDISFTGAALSDPDQIERYGLAIDVGVRWGL